MQFEVRQRTHVVKIQRISRVIGPCNVGVRPFRRRCQVEHGVGMGQAGRRVPRLKREIELSCPELEVIAPLGLRIEAVWRHRKQTSRGGVRQIENVLRRNQALVCIRRIADFENLVALGEVGGQPTRQIGADQGAGAASRVDEHWTMTNESIEGQTSLEVIIGLWKSPDIMVTDCFGIPVPDPHLVVKGFAIVIPHFLQPIEAEFRLIGEIRSGGSRSHLVRKVSNTNQQQRYGVTVSLHELQVVARVHHPPRHRSPPQWG